MTSVLPPQQQPRQLPSTPLRVGRAGAVIRALAGRELVRFSGNEIV